MLRIRAIFFVFVLISSNFVNGDPEVPCYFIFGDSLSDAGNNNALNTMAKANYSPYGVDFPGRVPTGRFTNGRTIADFITQFLGFEEFIQPYSAQIGQDALRGVNYASGASGILPETGSNLGERIWLDQQLQNYNVTISQLQSMVKGPVANYLNKCLYTVNIGSNDYINNYFLPQQFPSSKLFTKDEYATLLISRYQARLLALYDSGARKIAVFGLARIGCTPAEKARFNSTNCVDEINKAVELFNTKLVSVVDDFNSKLPEAKFTFINLFAMQSSTSFPFGFIMDSYCCKLRSDFMCEPLSPPCRSRLLHGYMDGFHPSEFVNQVAATIAYNDPFLFVHPMSIRQLI
ncbi:GDSL esterase/lipase At4g18970-like [Chenopodium quinoa]|uniref:GDSL esterase/lipase At4g18970-like n=1 Tax=Chenopodium quinoa TaxID=63459 RepID=UPI000B78635D|nr:GDSL esterase/lipase At4g18970-like [Chenopodium quinoa]